MSSAANDYFAFKDNTITNWSEFTAPGSNTVTVNTNHNFWSWQTTPNTNYQVVWQWTSPVLLMNAWTKLRCAKQGLYRSENKIITKDLPTGLIISTHDGKVELIWIDYVR